MRLLIIGALEGQLSEATKLAMQGGAKVQHAASIDIAMASLRAGRGADLLFVDVMIDIPGLIAALDGERIHIPVVACGTEIVRSNPDGVSERSVVGLARKLGEKLSCWHPLVAGYSD